jgi:hypothetical protein
MSQQESPDPSTTITDETVEPGKTNKGQTGEIKPPTKINIDQPTSDEGEPTAEEGTGASAGGA